MKRVFNFSAGPAVLPEPVLEKVAKELLNYQGMGISITEMSHRSNVVAKMIEDTKAGLRKHMKLNDDYHICFLQGGATTDFYRIPHNFVSSPEESVDYIHTGVWAGKAIATARHMAKVNIAGSSEDKNFSYLPKGEQLSFNPQSKYAYLCSNNTIYGTQFHDYPDTKDVPLIADFTSDLFARVVDYNRFAMIFASAQKNLAPSGCTVVAIKDSFLQKSRQDIPGIISYSENIKSNSVYNTPPVFIIYFINEVLKWMDDEGGISAIEKRNRIKAAMLYDGIDAHPDFYHATASREDRSIMNVTWHLPSPELSAKFLHEAEQHDLFALKGHRSAGGIRASIYNAMKMEGVERLADFMKKFKQANG